MLIYIILVLSLLLFPALYFLGMRISRQSFEKEENKLKKPISSVWEIIVFCSAELLTAKLWFRFIYETDDKLLFSMLFLALSLTAVVCVTDLRENLVSNKLLLLYLSLFVIITGIFFLRDIDAATEFLKSAAVGFVFCLLCFGVVYLVTRGGLGAGDVKLVILLGYAMTERYIVKALLLGCLISAVYSIYMLIRKKLTRHSAYPFVPFIYAGVALSIILS